MMGWLFNRKASASDHLADEVMAAAEKSVEQVRQTRLDLEKVIADMKERRSHVGGN